MERTAEYEATGEEKVNRVGLILRKEWLELRQERGLLIGTLLPPLFFTVLPVLLAWVVGVVPHKGTSMLAPPPDLGPSIRVGGPGTAEPIVNPNGGLEGLDTQAVEQAVIGSQFSIKTTGVAANTYGSATQVPSFTVSPTGQLSAASNVSIAIPASAVTCRACAGSSRRKSGICFRTNLTLSSQLG